MKDLVERAAEVRARAYAPYSNYPVGAAIEDTDGRVWTGVNVENVSFGATICAERSALVQMVTQGGREIARLAVVTRDGGTPCGLCLQVLFEFAPDPRRVRVAVADEAGYIKEFALDDLMPHGFRTDEVGKA